MLGPNGQSVPRRDYERALRPLELQRPAQAARGDHLARAIKRLYSEEAYVNHVRR